MAGYLKLNFLWALLSLPVGLAAFYFDFFRRKSRIDLKDKVVFITGVTSGLGRAVAEAFYCAGCKVILSSRDPFKLQQVQKEIVRDNQDCGNPTKPGIVVLNLEDLNSIPNQMAHAMNMFGQIDIVINNGGLSYRGMAFDCGLDVYHKIMTINFYSQCLILKCVLPSMMMRKQGHIVCISSIQGLIGLGNRSAYSASKHANEGYYDSLRAEMALFDIDVCVINPYYIKTNLSKGALISNGSVYGVVDMHTEKGYDPKYVAKEVLKSVINRDENKILCPLFVHLAVVLRTMAPSLFFKLMVKRSEEECKQLLGKLD